MPSLEKRISALEQANPTDGDKTIFILFQPAGEPATETHKLRASLTDSVCQHWTREPQETEEAFKQRASREVKRSPDGVAFLFKTDSTP